MVIFQNVSKFILSNVNVHIPKGSIVGIIGASGAGKTTFLKLACGLLEPLEGMVFTMRKPAVKAKREIAEQIGVLFADIPVFQAEQTLAHSFAERKWVYGMEEERFQDAYEELGRRLGYLDYMDSWPGALSLGQRRRAELGAVLLHSPKLILLDEPGIGLDQNAKGALRELLEERKKEGATILISSHDMEEISALCDRILLLDGGCSVFYGTKELLLKKYAPMDVCELVFEGRCPDFGDLPIEEHCIDSQHLTFSYDSNHISAAEILSHIVPQTKILSVQVKKADLTDTIKNIALERKKGIRYPDPDTDPEQDKIEREGQT